jgi:hypothetical protein
MGHPLSLSVTRSQTQARATRRTVKCLVMKKGIAFVLFAVALLWFAYSKVTQARREAAYRAAIAPFERDLAVGMDRAEVEKYLDLRKANYHAVRYGGSDADTYEIKIGEEPDNFPCERWTVYIALEFNATEKLREVHVRKVGTCL